MPTHQSPPRLLRIWSLLTFVTFGVLLLHQSDDAIILGRYSIPVALLLLVLLTLAVLSGSLGFLVKDRINWARHGGALDRLREFPAFSLVVLIVSALALIVLWLYFLGNHLPTYSFLRIYSAFTIIAFTLSILKIDSEVLTRKHHLLFVFFLVLLIVFAILTINYYPSLARTDEAATFSMARNALENRHLGPFIYRHVFPPDYFGGIWTWAMSAWLGLAGLNLGAGRLYILLVSLLTLVFVWLATSRLYNRLTAWYAVVIGIAAFISLNHIRYDIHAAFWLSVSLYFYSVSRTSSRWWLHILTGFAAGMCIDSNPITYCFGLGLGLAYGWEYIKAIQKQKLHLYYPFWLLVVGGSSALVLYLIIHSGESFGNSQTTGGMIGSYFEIIRSNLASGQYFVQITQYITQFLSNQPVLFGLMVLGLFSALKEKLPSDRFLLIMYFTWMAIISFAYFYFPVFYITLGLPLFCVLAARGIAKGLPWLTGTIQQPKDTQPKKGVTAYAVTLLLIIWLGSQMVTDYFSLPSRSLEDVMEAGRQISLMIPTEATIVAAEPYYFGLLYNNNFVGGGIENMMINIRDISPEKVWSTVNPDALVFSENWPTEPARSELLTQYMNEQDFVLRSCFETVSYGRVELWTRDSVIAVPGNSSTECQVICNPRTGC